MYFTVVTISKTINGLKHAKRSVKNSKSNSNSNNHTRKGGHVRHFLFRPRRHFASLRHCAVPWTVDTRIRSRRKRYTKKINVGDLSFDPGSLNRATGETVTESEVSRVFRGTDNRQSCMQF